MRAIMARSTFESEHVESSAVCKVGVGLSKSVLFCLAGHVSMSKCHNTFQFRHTVVARRMFWSRKKRSMLGPFLDVRAFLSV